MRVARIASGIALVAGLGLLAWAGLTGQLTVHLILVIPVVSGSGPAAVLGMLLAMGGLVGWFVTSVRSAPGGPLEHPSEPAGERERAGSRQEARGGGILLLGPIPIAWGSDRDSLLWVLVAAIVLILVAFLALTYLS